MIKTRDERLISWCDNNLPPVLLALVAVPVVACVVIPVYVTAFVLWLVIPRRWLPWWVAVVLGGPR